MVEVICYNTYNSQGPKPGYIGSKCLIAHFVFINFDKGDVFYIQIPN